MTKETKAAELLPEDVMQAAFTAGRSAANQSGAHTDLVIGAALDAVAVHLAEWHELNRDILQQVCEERDEALEEVTRSRREVEFEARGADTFAGADAHAERGQVGAPFVGEDFGIDIDTAAGGIYISLNHRRPARTEEWGTDVAVDYDADGVPTGVEILRPPPAAQVYRDLLGAIWLYVNWRYVTRQLTTEQKELWADAVDATGDPDDPGPKADRWWGADAHPSGGAE